jgi:hypothetical protein
MPEWVKKTKRGVLWETWTDKAGEDLTIRAIRYRHAVASDRKKWMEGHYNKSQDPQRHLVLEKKKKKRRNV